MARAVEPAFATASEVMAYPYMYHAPELRYEAPAAAQAGPSHQEGIIPQMLSFENPHSYIPLVREVPGQVPSYAPRALSSRYEQQASASATPVQGLSLMQMPPGPGVAYPGPTRGNTVQFSVAQALAGQAPMQVEAHAATTPQGGLLRQPPPVMQHNANGSTARYAQPMPQPQPGLAFASPSSLVQSMSMFGFNQVPTAAYTRPTHTPTQVPSFTAPLPPGHLQTPSYALPQMQQVLPGMGYGFPINAVPFPGGGFQANGAGASLTAPARDGGKAPVMVHPPARMMPGYA